MLENEGGKASEVEMVPGGWIAGYQIERVYKSPETGRVVSVGVWGKHPWRTNADGTPEMGLQNINIERAGSDVYRPPTELELEQFQERIKARKAEEKAAKPKEPPLINPTELDAERLQTLLNLNTRQRFSSEEPPLVAKMTQAQYSANSKGAYARCEIHILYADGRVSRKSTNLWSSEGHEYDKSLRDPVCKIRMLYKRVVVLTDKPQKSLPLDWSKVQTAEVA